MSIFLYNTGGVYKHTQTYTHTYVFVCNYCVFPCWSVVFLSLTCDCRPRFCIRKRTCRMRLCTFLKNQADKPFQSPFLNKTFGDSRQWIFLYNTFLYNTGGATQWCAASGSPCRHGSSHLRRSPRCGDSSHSPLPFSSIEPAIANIMRTPPVLYKKTDMSNQTVHFS